MSITSEAQRKALRANGWELYETTETDLPEVDNEVWRSPSRDCYVTLYDENAYQISPHTVHAYSRLEGDDAIIPASLAEAVQVASILGLLPSPSSDGVVVPKEAYQHLIGAAHQAMDTLDTVYLGLCAVADDEACRVAKIGLSRAVAALPTTKGQEAK